MRFVWHRKRCHATFVRQPVPFSRITRRTCGQYVSPLVATTPGYRYQMVTREIFACPQCRRGTATVLATVVIPRKQERICHLPSELPRDMNELGESNHRGTGDRKVRAANETPGFSLNDDSLAIDDQPQRSPYRNEREWFKRRIQRQAARRDSHHSYTNPAGLWAASGLLKLPHGKYRPQGRLPSD